MRSSTYTQNVYNSKGEVVGGVPVVNIVPEQYTIVIEGMRDDGKKGRCAVSVTAAE